MIKRIMAWFLLLPMAALAIEPAHLLSMRIQPSHDSTHFIFILSKKTSATVTYAPNPDRVLVDFSSTDKRFNIQQAKLAGANVETIDSNELPGGMLRFTLTTHGAVKWTTRFLPGDTANTVQFQLDVMSTKY